MLISFRHLFLSYFTEVLIHNQLEEECKEESKTTEALRNTVLDKYARASESGLAWEEKEDSLK